MQKKKKGGGGSSSAKNFDLTRLYFMCIYMTYVKLPKITTF